MRIPAEIIDHVMVYANFEQCVGISDYNAKKLFNDRLFNDSKWCGNNLFNKEMLNWLHQNGKENWIIKSAIHAANNSDKNTLEWLFINFNGSNDLYYEDVCNPCIVDIAAYKGDLVLIKW